MGTIDDLSDDEKTRAFLQLLEYKLRMEKEQVCYCFETIFCAIEIYSLSES